MTGGPSSTGVDRIRETLKERARALARPLAAAQRGEVLDLLTFGLAGEVYGMPSRRVQAVFRLTQVSALPGSTPPLFGVTAWRGDVLTILDLRTALGLHRGALNDLRQVIVVGDGRVVFGILADEAHGIVAVPTGEIHPVSGDLGGRGAYLRGITSNAVLVIDDRRMFESVGVHLE